jgi:tetratricopeptide (TPR) repeat protein
VQRLPILFLLSWISAVPAARAESVLVLPFFNETGSPNIDWIGESIAEALRESLASQDVLVLTRDDRLEGYRRLSLRPNAVLTHASVIKVGEALDASQVIYGRYEITHAADPAVPARDSPNPSTPAITARDSVRITARILDLQHTRQGPEFAEIGALEDLASLETHLAWQCLKALAPNKAISEEEFRRDRPTLRLDAIENYIRGLLAPTPEQQHRLFTQAVRLDPRFSEPCFQLGKMEFQKKDYAVAVDWLQKVSRADSHYFEASFLLGLCRYYTGDFAGAAKRFETVAGPLPLNEVLNNLGAAQSRLGLPAALDNFRRAAEGDTTDPDYQFNIGYVLWKRGDFAAAADSFRALLDRSPDDSEAVIFLGRCLHKDGPRPGDPKSEGRERLKLNFEETAYRQLKAELESKH